MHSGAGHGEVVAVVVAVPVVVLLVVVVGVLVTVPVAVGPVPVGPAVGPEPVGPGPEVGPPTVGSIVDPPVEHDAPGPDSLLDMHENVSRRDPPSVTAPMISPPPNTPATTAYSTVEAPRVRRRSPWAMARLRTRPRSPSAGPPVGSLPHHLARVIAPRCALIDIG